MGQVRVNKFCKHCSRRLRAWENKLGSYTFWCDGCDAL